MRIRNNSKLQSGLLLGTLLGSSLCVQGEIVKDRDKQKPNVLVILADDLGNADVGYHRQQTEIPTPHIDAIAKAGVRFTAGYVTAPVCGPSRAALMTGRYQQSFGFEDNPGPFRVNEDVQPGIPLSVKTMAEYVKPLGYATGCVGKWHIGGEENDAFLPNNRGFDEFFGFLGGAASYFPGENTKEKVFRNLVPVKKEEHYLTDALGREAIDFITRHKEEPFLLYLPFNAVHGPLQAPQELINKFSHVEPEERRILCAMQYSMDQNIGRVLAALKKLNLEENTLVIFLSDNGGKLKGNHSYNLPYRGQKGTLFEGGVRLPFCMKWPGHIEADSQYNQPISSMDLLPTILEIAGDEVNETCEFNGVNLMPYLSGEKKEAPHEFLFWRINKKKWAVRDADWKLVYSDKDKKSLLFNISEDISEKHDLSEEYPQEAKRLKAKFDEWASQMMEPQWGWQPTIGEHVRHTSEDFEKVVKLQFEAKNKVNTEFVTNPIKSGINKSNTVLQISLPAGLSTVAEISSDVPRFNKKFRYAHIKVLSQTAAEIQMTIGHRKNKGISTKQNNKSQSGKWVDLVFDFKHYKAVVSSMSIQVLPAENTETTLYIDDIAYSNDPKQREY